MVSKRKAKDCLRLAKDMRTQGISLCWDLENEKYTMQTLSIPKNDHPFIIHLYLYYSPIFFNFHLGLISIFPYLLATKVTSCSDLSMPSSRHLVSCWTIAPRPPVLSNPSPVAKLGSKMEAEQPNSTKKSMVFANPTRSIKGKSTKIGIHLQSLILPILVVLWQPVLQRGDYDFGKPMIFKFPVKHCCPLHAVVSMSHDHCKTTSNTETRETYHSHKARLRARLKQHGALRPFRCSKGQIVEDRGHLEPRYPHGQTKWIPSSGKILFQKLAPRAEGQSFQHFALLFRYHYQANLLGTSPSGFQDVQPVVPLVAPCVAVVNFQATVVPSTG